MAGRSKPPRAVSLFLDANVLYSAGCRDLLIEASLEGLCRCLWSMEVLVEFKAALLRTHPDLKPSQTQRLFDLLASACPDAMQRQRSADLIALPPMDDPADAHVLLGAYAARAEMIITFNLRHFPRRLLGGFGLGAMTPDQWLCSMAKPAPAVMIEIAERCRSRLVRPPLSRADHLEALRRSGLPRFAAFLASR
jgi:predicted nucleic acid-binding protein